MGFEPTTSCLGSKRSTTELHPRSCLHVDFTPRQMQKQPVDRLLLESLASITSLESLAKGYILNRKIEGKSSNTITGYEILFRNFIATKVVLFALFNSIFFSGCSPLVMVEQPTNQSESYAQVLNGFVEPHGIITD